MKVIALLLIAATTLSLGACSESNEEIQQRSEGIVAGDNTSSSNQIASERIIYRGDPPYLTNQPILDGKLYVNNTDDYLLFGGENIEEIREIYHMLENFNKFSDLSIKNNSYLIKIIFFVEKFMYVFFLISLKHLFIFLK